MTNKEFIEFKKLIAKQTLLANEHLKAANNLLGITRNFAARVTAKKCIVSVPVLAEMEDFIDRHLN